MSSVKNQNVKTELTHDIDEKRKHDLLELNDKQASSDTSAIDQKVRKKAGRKPATTEPANKRLAQNRAAQRAFRERKDNYVKELEDRIAELEKAHKQANEENVKLVTKLEAIQKGSKGVDFGKDFKHNSNIFDFTIDKSLDSFDNTTLTPSSEKDKDFSVDSKDCETDCPSLDLADSSPSSLKESHVSTTTEQSSLPSLKTETPVQQSVSLDQIASIPPSSSGELNTNDLLNFLNAPVDLNTDYMMPFNQNYGSNLFSTFNTVNNLPQVDFSQFDNSLFTPNLNMGYNQGMYGLNAIGLNPSLVPQELDFNPVLLADHLNQYDPLLASGMFPQAQEQPLLPEVVAGMQLLDFQTKMQYEQLTRAQLPDPALASNEFDIDNLCSLMRDKATCSEKKMFYKMYCNNQPPPTQ